MHPARSSAHTFSGDITSAVTATIPLPGGSVGAGWPNVPANYVFVIDSITVSITGDTQDVVGISLHATDGTLLYDFRRDIADAEIDFMHVAFPKGLVVPRFMSSTGTGQAFGTKNVATYDLGNAFLQQEGSAAAIRYLITYRFVHPSQI